MSSEHLSKRYNDLAEIFRLRDLVSSLDPEAPPTAFVADKQHQAASSSIAVIPGSFNPLTVAHAALGSAVKRMGVGSFVYFLLSKVTVGKEQLLGARMEDRLLVLQAYTEARGATGTLITNRGLYVDEAAAVREAFPDLRDLNFIIGHDKLIQIFDRRYYLDRDAALRELFSRANLVVANRTLSGPREIDRTPSMSEIMRGRENERYFAQTSTLDWPASLSEVSSTEIRDRCAKRLPIKGLAPREVIEFIKATGAYLGPQRLSERDEVDRYAVRNALIDALDMARDWALRQVDFTKLLPHAWSESREGRELRDALTEGDNKRALAAVARLASRD